LIAKLNIMIDDNICFTIIYARLIGKHIKFSIFIFVYFSIKI